ncbi:MAG TPA: IPTL-CTERM sorting domain-containing protein [Thermoanaerobaculia bacterium]|nr:IPTL-CTERM sorting domain-containing protein [Thermoanaerobaculia bacterium]
MKQTLCAFALIVACAFGVQAQDAGFAVQITPENPTSQQVVQITVTGFCYGDPVQKGNVFEITFGPVCVGPPIPITETFFVGPLAPGPYVVRVVQGVEPGDPPAGGPPLFERSFVVAAAPAPVPAPTLNEYALMFLAAALALIAFRRAM